MAKSLADRILSAVLGSLAAFGGLAMLPYAVLAVVNWNAQRGFENPAYGPRQAAVPVLVTWSLILIAFYVAARFFWYTFSKDKPE